MSEQLKVSITGIDGAGKDTTAELVANSLVADGISPILKTNRPVYMVDESGTHEVFAKANSRIDSLHNVADQRRNPSQIVAVNAVNVVLHARRFENSPEAKNAQALISSRDWRLDPVVYSEFYLPRIASLLPTEKRIRFLQILTASERDAIVLLKIDPELAVERIKERMRQEAGDDPDDHMRLKWRHMHETVPELTRLQAGYDPAATALQAIRPETRIIEIDTTYLDKLTVSAIAQQALHDTIDGIIKPGERIEL